MKGVKGTVLVGMTLALAPATGMAAGLLLVPPPTLTIDGQSISTGQVTVGGFVGYRGGNAFPSAQPTRVKDVTIGSTTAHKIVDDPSLPDITTFDAIMFNFQFDPVTPDLPAMPVVYVSNTPTFIIDLPFASDVAPFTQVTISDDRSDNLYFDLPPERITTSPLSGVPTVDLGNGLFAEFPAGAAALPPPSFQSHGSTSPVPLPAPLLMSFGAIAALGGLKLRRDRAA